MNLAVTELDRSGQELNRGLLRATRGAEDAPGGSEKEEEQWGSHGLAFKFFRNMFRNGRNGRDRERDNDASSSQPTPRILLYSLEKYFFFSFFFFFLFFLFGSTFFKSRAPRSMVFSTLPSLNLNGAFYEARPARFDAL